MSHHRLELDDGAVGCKIRRCEQLGRPLYLVILATKPCYIKLASLVLELERHEVSYLLVESGQHYESLLTRGGIDLGIQHLVDVALGIRGDIAPRLSGLALCLQQLWHRLQQLGLKNQPAVPVVSGDTFTAALVPQFWYFLTGIRSVHVEAGLRSYGPGLPLADLRESLMRDLCGQRQLQWNPFPDDPFPEGIDTRLASVGSCLLLAPVARNVDDLLKENYSQGMIRRVGSLSSDAVHLAAETENKSIFSVYPYLRQRRWLRVDIHRRENMTVSRITAVLAGLGKLAASGIAVVLVMTNALRTALQRYELNPWLQSARDRGVIDHPMWPSYPSVIEFLRSPHCLGIYTDSGGMQEEAHILGVPCVTCRFSTDRVETVLDAESNLLLPPIDEAVVYNGLSQVFTAAPGACFPDLGGSNEYGEDVGARIADILATWECSAR